MGAICSAAGSTEPIHCRLASLLHRGRSRRRLHLLVARPSLSRYIVVHMMFPIPFSHDIFARFVRSKAKEGNRGGSARQFIIVPHVFLPQLSYRCHQGGRGSLPPPTSLARSPPPCLRCRRGRRWQRLSCRTGGLAVPQQSGHKFCHGAEKF